MRRVVALTCIAVVATGASAFAAHFDVIPAGTISVNNTIGTTTGSLVNGNLGWADIATGSKVFDFSNVKLAKLEGSVTEIVGQRGLGAGGSWAGTWGTIGLAEYDWIDGGYVGLGCPRLAGQL